MKPMLLQKIRLLELESPILLATLLAVCLGGSAAWATTGVFSVGLFFIVTALGLAVQAGLSRLKPYLLWIFSPLLVIVVYWTQAGRLTWAAVWPALILAAARFGNRGYVAVYVLLLISVVVGGIPVWCLLCLLSAPLAWRVRASGDAADFEEWAVVTGMFLVAGYVIKGLIR